MVLLCFSRDYYACWLWFVQVWYGCHTNWCMLCLSLLYIWSWTIIEIMGCNYVCLNECSSHGLYGWLNMYLMSVTWHYVMVCCYWFKDILNAGLYWCKAMTSWRLGKKFHENSQWWFGKKKVTCSWRNVLGHGIKMGWMQGMISQWIIKVWNMEF